jgi:DNA polymerase-3 subunit beta
MKIQITKDLLSTATRRVQGAITERSLAQIGLSTKAGQLQVAATDRILAVYSKLPCETLRPGTVFVPARLFSDVVKELPEGPVKLDHQNAYLVITAGKDDEFTMKLPVIDDLTWREAPALATDNSAEIPAAKLSYMIGQVQFCIAQDSPRNYGSVGFLHKPNKETCRLVGTDGFRLSYCEVETAMPDGFLDNGICLSKRALSELERMCDEGFEKIRLSIADDETTLVAEVPDYQIFVRLSAVKYPSYMGVLPEKKMAGVLISRNHMQNVAKRVLLAADKSRALQLSFSDSSLTLNSKTMGSSEGRETVPLMDYHGPRYDIAVNGKFLTDIFTTTGSDNVTLHFSQESNEDPIVIVPRQEPQSCRSKHVLVPIKQND